MFYNNAPSCRFTTCVMPAKPIFFFNRIYILSGDSEYHIGCPVIFSSTGSESKDDISISVLI